MNAARRSPFFRILTLGLAVLLSQTVHAAQPARALTGAPPPHVKLTSAQPEAEKDFGRPAKKLRGPRRTQAQRTALRTSLSSTAFLPAHIVTGERATAQQLGAPAQFRDTIYIAPQFRPFALRI